MCVHKLIFLCITVQLMVTVQHAPPVTPNKTTNAFLQICPYMCGTCNVPYAESAGIQCEIPDSTVMCFSSIAFMCKDNVNYRDEMCPFMCGTCTKAYSSNNSLPTPAPTPAQKALQLSQYTCTLETTISGTADVRLSNGKTEDIGYSSSKCESECTSKSACKSFIWDFRDGYVFVSVLILSTSNFFMLHQRQS